MMTRKNAYIDFVTIKYHYILLYIKGFIRAPCPFLFLLTLAAYAKFLYSAHK